MNSENHDLLLAAIGLNQRMLPVFLGLLLATAIAWMFLSRRLYTELRKGSPGLYKTLGSPQLFMKESLATNFRVIGFLFRQDYLQTGDPKIIRLGRGLRYLFYIYIFCLAGGLLLLLDMLV